MTSAAGPDWVGTVSTAAVGIAGIAATVWVQRAERKESRRSAADARTQDRKQAAYERLLKQAIEVTEFVGNADVIFVRHAQPPDVDTESYDAWLLLHLYASKAFKATYHKWQDAVGKARNLLDQVPEKKAWYDMRGDFPDRFRDAAKKMDQALSEVILAARAELSG